MRQGAQRFVAHPPAARAHDRFPSLRGRPYDALALMKPSKTLQPLLDALIAKLPAGDDGLMAVVDLAVLVAMADGTIDQAERAAVTASIETIVGGPLSRPVVGHLFSQSRAQVREEGWAVAAHRIGAMLAARECVDE